MQAIEFIASVDDYHQVHLKLPDSIQVSSVKIIVMYDENKSDCKPVKLGLFKGRIHMAEDFNDPLPDGFWLQGSL